MALATNERFDVIDALRGVAVLGILWINLPGHAFPFLGLWDPYVAGGSDSLNVGFWTFTQIFVEGSMRGLFSFLFGVGIILFMRSADGAEPRLHKADLYMRRNLYLILFGLIHGFLLLSPGDILYTYGLCALILFPLRLAQPRTLAILGVCCLTALAVLAAMEALENAEIKAAAMDALNNGLDAPEDWMDLQRAGPEFLEMLRSAVLGSYNETLSAYAPEYASTIFSPSYAFFLLDALGPMFLGMALMKAGVLSGNLATGSYFQWGAMFLIVALGARIWTTSSEFATDFIELNWIVEVTKEFARPLLTIAYVLLFVGFWNAGKIKWTSKALSMTGRMALTHYICGTLFATFIFYGYGLGLYDQLNRIETMGVVVGIWIFQITFSLVWLKRFTMGPLEWGWRSLVHLKPVPLRRAA